MTLTINEIKAAQTRISKYIVKTPLLRLHNLDKYLGCQVYAKAECMQITESFKFRGAMNKILSLSKEELQNGIVAASSGNHGKAIAFAAKRLGLKATIVLPYSAAKIKVETIKALGAEIIQCDVNERFNLAEKLCQQRSAVLIPPFNDETIMAGQGTAGLEIIEQCPDLNTVIIPASGGGLLGGVSVAIKTLSPKTIVYGTEPAVLPRYTASLKAGNPVTVPPNKTIADGLVSQIPGNICYPYVAANTDAFADVDEKYILKGMKLMITKGKLLCEPSSGIVIGAVLQGLIPVKSSDKVCFFISGGSVSLEQLKILEDVDI